MAGAGGQGVVTAGRILAEAAILCGRNAAHTQVFGPQSRGGASRSDVVIADGDIGFPLTDSIDFLIVLSGEAYARYAMTASDACRLLVDRRAAGEPAGTADGTHFFPVVDTARAVSGGQLVSGVVALGLVQGFAGIVEAGPLRRALADRIPPRHREMNLEALEAGMRLASEVGP